jgi:phosphatidylethanolamine-binding protein (PEBP) family uncharacterized protein
MPQSRRRSAPELLQLTIPGLLQRHPVLPARYTCRGRGISPPLRWSPLPGAVGYALVVSRVAAPARRAVHWAVTHIPRQTTSLRAGEVPKVAVVHANDFGKRAYRAPCPHGSPERYEFVLYALVRHPRPKIRASVPPAALPDILDCCERGLGLLEVTARP